MAKVLSSISLDAPAAPVSASVNDTFAFSGTPSLSGGGGVQRYDFKWEVDSGGGYVTIASSGTGLTTADTNPLVNTNSQTQNSITVTCSQSGSYTIRMAGAPTSGGSYTVLSSTQTVTVSSGPQTFPQSMSATATGSATLSRITTFSRALSVTATGTPTLSRVTTFLRTLSATATGAASVSIVTTFVRSLSASAIGMASLSTASVIGQVISATAVGVATLSEKIVLGVSMSASAVGAATLSMAAIFTQAVSAVAAGIATLATLFIEGVGSMVVRQLSRGPITSILRRRRNK